MNEQGTARLSSPSSIAHDRSILDVLPLVLLIYAAILPQEVHLTLAGQNIFAPRLVELVMLPWLLARIARRSLPLVTGDYLLLAGAAWMVIAFVAYSGFATGFVGGVALAMDVVLSYFIARLSIRDTTDFRRALVLVAPGMFVAGLSLAIESIAGRPLVRPFFAATFGGLNAADLGLDSVKVDSNNFRFGLFRATGPFPHSILAGLILGGAACIFLSSGLRGWPKWIGVFAGGFSILTISSAALLMLVFGAAMTAYDRIQRRVAFLDWRKAAIAGTIACLVIQLVTTNGIAGVAQRVSLTPGTAYFRRLIWRFGSQSVAEHPWIGIAFDEYDRLRWMVSSIDNQWLALAVRHGLITPIAFFTLTVLAIVSLSRRAAASADNETERQLFASLAFIIFIYLVLGFTVAFFGGMVAWFNALLGVAVSLTARTQVIATAPARTGAPVRAA